MNPRKQTKRYQIVQIVTALLLVVLCDLIAYTQHKTEVAVEGTIVDSATRQSLPQAPVPLLSAAD